MTIELITPLPKSTIGAGASISFTVASTYTQMDIQESASKIIYTTAGGPQSGYTVKVVDNGNSTHTFNITKDAGWDLGVTVLQVTEDQDTDVEITVFSYELPGVNRFPRTLNPTRTSDFARLMISEDDGTPILDVEHIDLVSGTPPDGLNGDGSLTPTAQIEATAATTDPDALHDNEANEISALTTKGIDATTPDDWAVIEDSADSWAKKKMTVENLVGYGSPRKMEADDNTQFLYKFNNNYNNDGLVTDTQFDPLGQGFTQCRRIQFDDKVGGEEGRHFNNSSTSKASSYSIASPTAAISAVGDCTIQWYGAVGGEATTFRDTTNGYCMFAFRGQNAVMNRVSWGLWLYNDGVNQNFYYPAFIYSNAANTLEYTTMDSSFVLQELNRYHIVGRRRSDGLGSYDCSLWVNGLKIAEDLGQPAAYSSGSGESRLTHGSETGAEGLERVHVFCTKMDNVALTDTQINSEYKRALGYV